MSLWVNLSVYGRMRGCSSEAVKQAILAGRLKNSVRKKENGKYEVNPEVANLEWQLNTDHTRRFNAKNPDLIFRPEPTPTPFVRADMPPRTEEHPEDSSTMQMAEARRLKEEYTARIARLKFEQESGFLVLAEDVKHEAFKIARSLRDSIMNVPDRVSAEFAGMTSAHEIHLKLSSELRKTLESLKFE